MSSDNNRNIGLSEIIRMLENNVTFTQAADSVLECITDSMDICDAVVMQIDRESDTMHVISETGNCFKDESGTVKRSEFVLCSDAIKITYEGNADTAQKGLLDRLGVKLSITVPILINNVKAMYLIVLSNDVQAVSDNKIKEYISDMALVLHGIAQSKVINNSLISSYDVLQKILDNIGSGIIVCSRYSGNILFENEMAANVQEVRDTIRECLEDVFTCEDVHRNIGASMERYNTESGLWFEVRFSELEWIDGSEVIVVTAVDITQKKKNQQKIEYQAHNDFLTGLYNRMKCEVDLRKVIRRTEKAGLKGAVLFIDLDDFKHINDGLGHQYGDILLQQIAAGLTGIPGLRGHCYRMGGDEFAAILFVKREQFEWIRRQFDGDIKYWSCNRIKELSISYGYVSSSECQWDSMKEISDVADIRMYEEKAMYYKKNGVDRQGQPASYVALYRLYTQILRINLEKDCYKILNWEETKNKKKQDSIGALSEWFHNFEDIRLIHSDDLVKYLRKTKIEYLKKQFANKKKFVTITYRRKEGDGYKRITLEIIPEDENSQNTYEGFLYVKE